MTRTPPSDRLAIALMILIAVATVIYIHRLDQQSRQSAQAHEARLAGWVRS